MGAAIGPCHSIHIQLGLGPVLECDARNFATENLIGKVRIIGCNGATAKIARVGRVLCWRRCLGKKLEWVGGTEVDSTTHSP